jgi:hypothetical protein
MQSKTKKGAVEKVFTGIRGFDEILMGKGATFYFTLEKV